MKENHTSLTFNEIKDKEKILTASREKNTGHIQWNNNCDSIISQPRNISSAKLAIKCETTIDIFYDFKKITSHTAFVTELLENMRQDLRRGTVSKLNPSEKMELGLVMMLWQPKWPQRWSQET